MLARLKFLVLFLAWACSLGCAPAVRALTQPKAPQTSEIPRVALVIGNNDYQQVQKLNNAVPDARAMAKEFRALGFDVIEKINVDQRAMKAAVREFVKRVGNGGVGAFFYAGHGVQEGGDNYLLPVDISKLTDPGALVDEAVELNSDIMARVGQAGAKFSLLVIDACRDNPFPKRAGRSVGGTRGLTAAAETPEGMVVVYSAGVGQQALDRLDDNDRNPNGLFTREFVVELRKPGVEVAEMVRNVRQRVKAAAATVQHEQTPAIYIQADRFYLVAPPPLPEPPIMPSSEDALWAQLDSDKPCEYQAYLEEYPKGKFAALARIRARDCIPTARVAPTATVAMTTPPAAQQRPLSLPPAAAGRDERAAVPIKEPPPAKAAPTEQVAKALAPAPVPVPAKAVERREQTAQAAVPPAAANVPTKAAPKGKSSSQAVAKETTMAPSKSGPFSSVKDSEPSKMAVESPTSTASADSFLELPLPALVAPPAEVAEKSPPREVGRKKPSPVTAPLKLEITPPPREEKIQVAMLAPAKDALASIRTKREPGDQPELRAGDAWTLQRVDLYTGSILAGWQERLHSIDGTLAKLDSSTKVGRSVTSGLVDLDLATWRIESARIIEGKPVPLTFPLSVGKSWEYSYRRKRNDDLGVTHYHVKATVDAWEKVETPAGVFDAFKVVHIMHYETQKEGRNWSSASEQVYWYAPAARRWVRRDFIDRDSRGRIADKYREEVIGVSLSQ